MFEEMSFELIMNRMLSRVNTDVDKREGSIIWDALAPAAAELALMYIQLDTVLNEAFADTATREYLIKRAAERGLSPYPATNAAAKAVVTPDNINVLGQRFSCGEYNYTLTEKISDGVYRAECETEGAAPNGTFGTLIPIDYIPGLQSASLTQLIVPGEDEEDTEVFRQRYMDSLQSQAFGGNVADYKQKVMALDGVGGVKVYKAADWNGAGTVKLVIQNSEYKVPSPALINTLQTDIDPLTNSGEGIGIAPIGHQVTVVAVDEGDIYIDAVITYADGYDFNMLKSTILSTVAGYLEELNRDWANVQNINVFIMQIGARLLNIAGITDVSDIRINGSAANFALGRDAIIDIAGSLFNDEVLGQ
ncbi:MAG: baseplate J/gp47 family protein [Firmicutes bacterium]|nr:baseplate J/gp47 family protein [Bacillota bacterium]